MKRELLVSGILILCLAFFAAALPPQSPPRITAQITNVYNGNTVELEIESIGNIPVVGLIEGQLVKVRYIGINTTEHIGIDTTGIEKRFIKKALELNKRLVSGRQVFLALDVQLWNEDDQLLAYVYLDKEGYVMVNMMLVAIGLARFQTVAEYRPNIRYESIFETLQATAKKLGLGIWYSGNDNKAPCNCTGPDLNCPPAPDFATPEEAQRCYEYCISQGYGDIFDLDRDNDRIACDP